MIGNQPSLTNNVASKTISVTASGSQTLFTVTGGYRINQLAVYRNGTRLVDSLDYTARDGATVTLLSPASGSDVIEFQVFDDFRVADALDVNSGGTVNGNVTVTGIVSATSFYGDGTNLTNTGSTLSAASGTERVVFTNLTSGTMTASSTDANVTYNATTQTLSVPNVSIAGTLTYEDVTNVDSIGIITARSTIDAQSNVTVGTNLSVSGISTLGNTVVGGATTELIVNGDARVTGILTIGTSSITLDGTVNQVNVGTGVTLHHSNGVQVGENTLHSTGLTVNNLNSSGVITSTSFNVGTAVTINSSGVSAGVVTATNFSGDGSALTGIVAATASALNSTGVSTVHTLYHPSQSNPLIVSRTGGSYSIYISDSGNDSTGDGTSGNPYRGLNKAFSMVPDIVNRQSIHIQIQGASYTLPGSVDLRGIGGHGYVYGGQQILISPSSGTATFNLNNYSMAFYDCDVPLSFASLNFVGGVNVNAFFMDRCKFLYMQNTCTWTSNSTYGWSYGGGGSFYRTELDWRAPVTISSSSTAGLGAIFVFYDCNVRWNANIIKSGTRFGNTAISINNNSFFDGAGCTISNFAQGIVNGYNHYGAETGGNSMMNGLTLSNCNTGLILANGAVNRAYSIIYSGNSTNISSTNSFST